MAQNRHFLLFFRSLGLISTLGLYAVVPLSSRQFFAPGGTSPTGSHQLSSFKHGNGNYSQFYALESVEAQNTRSGKIYGSSPTADLRGYGPSISAWSLVTDKQGKNGPNGDLVVISYQSRKFTDLVALSNNANGYFKRIKAYKHSKVLEATVEAIKNKAEELGIPESSINIWGEWSYATQLVQEWQSPNSEPVWVEPSYPIEDRLLKLSFDQEAQKYHAGKVAYKVGASYYVTDSSNEGNFITVDASSLVVFSVDPNKNVGQRVQVEISAPTLYVNSEDKAKVLKKIENKFKLETLSPTERAKLFAAPPIRPELVPEEFADEEQ